MRVFDTPEKLAQRRREFENHDISRLFALYDKRYRAGDLVGANRIAWILSVKHGIEGDHSFAVGASQE